PGTTGDSLTVVWHSPGGADSAPVTAKMTKVFDQVRAQPGVGSFDQKKLITLSRDGQTAIVQVPLVKKTWDFSLKEQTQFLDIVDAVDGADPQVAFGGNLLNGGSTPTWPGLVAALIILLIAFGSVVASGLPVVTAIFGLGIGMMLVGLLTALVGVPDWTPAIANLLAIGVGIDYSLLVLTRFRDALDRDDDVRRALIEAVTTAGRSVLVAGGTVVIAVMGLFLIGVEYMRGVAMATSLSILVVMVAAITLLPAMLAMLGPRVNKWKLPGVATAHERRERENDPDHLPLAARWSRQVQKRPWPMAVAATTVLLLLAAPAIHMKLGFPDASNDGVEATTYKAYALVDKGFGAGTNGPLLVVADLNGVKRNGAAGANPKDSLGTLESKLKQTKHVVAVAPPQFNAKGNTALIVVTPDQSPQTPVTKALVNNLRDNVIPAATAGTGVVALVGGATASYIDQSDYLSSKIIIFISAVVLLSLLILLLAFRSPVIAIKAGIMNMLSVGAAYGVMTLAAKGGWFGQTLGINSEVPIAPFLPVIMFAILFGLSMDYEVFLMSRVREEYLKGAETHDAVTMGLARTARVITAAAAIMIAVFMSFALAPQVFLRVMGFGMATAIFVDATIVRMILVPATLQILGKANWWIPDWLDRILPHWDIEPANFAADTKEPPTA
ncbi:MAG: MMPL family transporter, partial [Thermoleophilaceae bacterium]|nr:MMPL family transporter [Thermoleophilaceae bacterium]